MTAFKTRTVKVMVVIILTIALSFAPAAWTGAQSTQPSGKEQHCVAQLDPVSPESEESSKVTPLGCYDTYEEAISIAASDSASSSSNRQHCVVHLDPVSPEDNKPSKATSLGCYNTFEEAISVATDGTVKLPAGISPHDVTNDLLIAYGMGSVPTASVVIGTDYNEINFSPTFGTFTWTGSANCSPTLGYNVPAMPSGYDNWASSAKSYSDCYKYFHYENTNYGGTSIRCDMGNTCANMGYMNNKTSSEKWRY